MLLCVLWVFPLRSMCHSGTFLQDLIFSVQCEQVSLWGCGVCQAGSSHIFGGSKCLLLGLSDLQVEGITVFWNTVRYLPSDRAPHSTRLESSFSPCFTFAQNYLQTQAPIRQVCWTMTMDLIFLENQGCTSIPVTNVSVSSLSSRQHGMCYVIRTWRNCKFDAFLLVIIYQ